MREFEEKRFASSDGIHQCYYIVVRPDGEPKGILQIAHGMCEYIDRYRAFMITAMRYAATTIWVTVTPWIRLLSWVISLPKRAGRWW